MGLKKMALFFVYQGVTPLGFFMAASFFLYDRGIASLGLRLLPNFIHK